MMLSSTTIISIIGVALIFAFVIAFILDLDFKPKGIVIRLVIATALVTLAMAIVTTFEPAPLNTLGYVDKLTISVDGAQMYVDGNRYKLTSTQVVPKLGDIVELSYNRFTDEIIDIRIVESKYD